MRTTIDAAGRLVVPKILRDQVGLVAGEVDVVADGTGLRIEPIANAEVVELDDGWQVIRASGTPIDDDTIRELRLGLQH